MPQPLIAAIPNDITLAAGYVIRVVALNPTSGATVAGVRATDVAFQVANTSPAGDGGSAGVAPLPLLVPSSDVQVDATPTPTPSTSPSSQTTGGPLHTQAVAVTDTAQRTFALAVADKLEPVTTPTVQLPAGSTPFHALSNAISDVAVHLWAAAVANTLEPM